MQLQDSLLTGMQKILGIFRMKNFISILHHLLFKKRKKPFIIQGLFFLHSGLLKASINEKNK